MIIEKTDSITETEDIAVITQTHACISSYYPSFPILIQPSSNEGYNPRVLDFCQHLAQNVPTDFKLAKQMLQSALASLPPLMGTAPLRIENLISNTKDVQTILEALHDLYIPRKYPLRQPLRFIQDYLKFGGKPFLTKQDQSLIKTLQKHLGNHTPTDIQSLHKELRRIVPRQADYDHCNQRCLWILDKLTKLELNVGTIQISHENIRPSRLAHIDRWTHHIAPVIILSDDTYVLDMLSPTILTTEQWVQQDWISTNKENLTIEINKGYRATEYEINIAIERLATLYYRELEMPL